MGCAAALQVAWPLQHNRTEHTCTMGTMAQRRASVAQDLAFCARRGAREGLGGESNRSRARSRRPKGNMQVSGSTRYADRATTCIVQKFYA